MHDAQALTLLQAKIASGDASLEVVDETNGLSYDSGEASALICESQAFDKDRQICLAGQVSDDLYIWNEIKADLEIGGMVNGNLFVQARIHGELKISGHINGNVLVTSRLGSLHFSGQVEGSVEIASAMDTDLKVCGSIGRNLQVWSAVGEKIAISGSIEGDVSLSSDEDKEHGGGQAPTTTVDISALVRGQVRVSSLGGRYFSIRSLTGAHFGGPVFLGDYISLADCDFRGFRSFEQLQFVGDFLFSTRRYPGFISSRRVVDERPNGGLIPNRELAFIYRNLRVAYEAQSNRAEAGDFYFGEMESRLGDAQIDVLTLKQWKSIPKWLVLLTYREISGFGQSAGRAVLVFGFVAVISGVLFSSVGVEVRNAREEYEVLGFAKAIQFSVRTMVSFFSPPEAKMGYWVEWVQIGLRFVGPAVLAQAVLAVREKVAR